MADDQHQPLVRCRSPCHAAAPIGQRWLIQRAQRLIEQQDRRLQRQRRRQRGLVLRAGGKPAQRLAIPLNTNVAYPIGARIIIRKTTSQTVTVAWATGVTVLNSSGTTLTVTGVTSSTVLRKTDTDGWIAFPDLPESTIGGALRTAIDAPTAKSTIGLSAVSNVTLAEPRASGTQIGTNAALGNTTSTGWVAIGIDAGRTNASGTSWLAIGNSAGRNAIGSSWVAIGSSAGLNSTGYSWTAIGVNAGLSCTGSNWTAIGYVAGADMQGGSSNTMIGYNTGRGVTTGSANTIIGANVTGLAGALTNNVILASGDGVIKLQVDANGLTTLASLITTNTTSATSTTTGAIQASGVGLGSGRWCTATSCIDTYS